VWVVYVCVYVCVCVWMCLCVGVVSVWVCVYVCVCVRMWVCRFVGFFFINTKHASLHSAILHAMVSLISLLFILY